MSYGNEIRAGSSFPPAPNRRHDRYEEEEDDEEDDEEGATFSSSSSPSSASPPPAAASSSSPLPAIGRRRPSGTPSHARSRATRSERGGDSSSSSASPGPRSSRSEQPYSKVVARTVSPGPSAVAAVVSSPSIADDAGKPSLRVDTSVAREEKEQAVEAVVGPLEALKLATGSTVQEPAWAQPFPAATAARSDDVDDAVGVGGGGAVFSPFGLGFEGGIHRPAVSAITSSTISTSSAMDGAWTSAPMDAPQSALSSSSFASIDAIFSQRSESSEALAGLLGVELSSAPMAHGTPTNGTSRFAFANSRGESLSLHSSPAHHRSDGLFDGGLTHRHSFGGYDAPPTSSAAAPLGFPSRHDTSAFPPLGGAPSSMPPPLPPRPSPFNGGFGGGPALHRTASMPSNTMGVAEDGGANGLAFLQQMLPNVNISFGGDFPNGGGMEEPPQASGRRLFQRSNSAGAHRAASSSGLGAWQSHDAFGPAAPTPTPSFHDPAIVSLSASSGLASGFYSGEDEGERAFHSFGDAFRRSGALLK